MSRSLVCLSMIVSWFASSAVALGEGSKASEYSPDPKSVQRYGPAYRYPQAGWVVLHIEGKPYDRGYQHGYLMASEIAGYLKCFAAMQSPMRLGMAGIIRGSWLTHCSFAASNKSTWKK